MPSVFIDTNVPMYAGGAAHPLREPAQQVIRAIVAGELDAVTDTEVFQEILYRYFAIGERRKGLLIFDTFHSVMDGRVLPVTDVETRRARDLAERYPRLSPRDLIHLGVMLVAPIAEVVSADAGFDEVAEVSRIRLESF